LRGENPISILLYPKGAAYFLNLALPLTKLYQHAVEISGLLAV